MVMVEHAAAGVKTRILNTTGDTLTVKDNPSLRKAVTALRDADPTICQRAVLLVIRGLMERVVLADMQSAVIGRADLNTGFQPDVDLTPYGARARGISRAHARLHVHHRHLYVTDLGSHNGTFIARKRLVPDVPYQLRSGDDLALGCLNMKVIFP
jgi:hypothetical protein